MINAVFILATTFVSAEPWYARPGCMAALESILAVDFEAAEAKIKPIEKSGDTDDQACGVWLRVSLAEAQLAVGGRLPALLDNRERMLKRMYGFSKAKGGVAKRFADLEFEARLRRVRVLVDKEEKSEALKEIQKITEMLEKRGDAEMNPTLTYSQGVTNAAVGNAPWALRTLMRIAGVKGDAQKGLRDLRTLEQSATVYKYDAMYLQHYFALASPDGDFGKPAPHAKKLADKFPTNPQFAIELAKDLYAEKKHEQALTAIAPFTAELEKKPSLYSSQLRANLYLLSGRCAKDLGKPELAKRYATLAEAQSYQPLADEIEALKDD
jgi:hypothetical protein